MYVSTIFFRWLSVFEKLYLLEICKLIMPVRCLIIVIEMRLFSRCLFVICSFCFFLIVVFQRWLVERYSTGFYCSWKQKVNAEKVAVSGKKRTQKIYRRHSGRPGGMKEETFDQLQHRIPERIVEHAVRGMLPKGRVSSLILNQILCVCMCLTSMFSSFFIIVVN